MLKNNSPGSIAVPGLLFINLERLLAQSYLIHICRVIPEERFLDHHAIFPVANSTHRQLESFACRLDIFSSAYRHRLGKSSFKHTSDTCPFSIFVTEANRMLLDPCIRCIDEHRAEVGNVFVDSGGKMSVRPVNLNVY